MNIEQQLLHLNVYGMNILLNIIWFMFGGVMIAIEYLISSIAMM